MTRFRHAAERFEEAARAPDLRREHDAIRVAARWLGPASIVCAALVGACASSNARNDAQAADAATAQTVGHVVRGRVLDLEGAPVVDLYATVSTEYCVPDRTSETGAFAVRNVLPGASKRLVLYGPTGKNGAYASLSVRFVGADDADLDFTRPLFTPRLNHPLPYRVDLDEPQRLSTDDGFAITVHSGELHLESFAAPRLYAVPIPLDKAPPFGANRDRLHALYVLEPLQSTFSKPAPVEFPNPRGLSDGTAVDIFQLDYASGELVVVAHGIVRDDGKIASVDGEGITELTWIGFAPTK